jgi:hypothetical protein
MGGLACRSGIQPYGILADSQVPTPFSYAGGWTRILAWQPLSAPLGGTSWQLHGEARKLEIAVQEADNAYSRGIDNLDDSRLSEAVADFTPAIEIDHHRANAYRLCVLPARISG